MPVIDRYLAALVDHRYEFPAAIVVVSALALIPRDIRTMQSTDAALPPAAEDAEAELETVPG